LELEGQGPLKLDYDGWLSHHYKYWVSGLDPLTSRFPLPASRVTRAKLDTMGDNFDIKT